MTTEELIKRLRNCGGGTEGIKLVNEAADTLERLLSENKQLRNNLIMQTALAQNEQGAIETNKQLVQQIVVLKAERDSAIEDIKNAIDAELICDFCKHKIECKGEECEKYMEGRGCWDDKRCHHDWVWTCMDFDFGTCDMLEDSPCNGCFDNDMRGFEWKGCVGNEQI